MSTVKIITDSSTTIEPQLVEELGITVVPLSVMIDGVLYSDSNLKEGEFLNLMRNSKICPRPVSHRLVLFCRTFSDLAKMVVRLLQLFCHALSGTVEAARQGVLSGVDVTVVDSTFTDQTAKFQVVEASSCKRGSQ